VDEQVRQLDKHSSDITKRWTVREGDSLWLIAGRQYGDPAQWRFIAEANSIEDPRYLEPGQELIIPIVE